MEDEEELSELGLLTTICASEHEIVEREANLLHHVPTSDLSYRGSGVGAPLERSSREEILKSGLSKDIVGSDVGNGRCGGLLNRDLTDGWYRCEL